MALDQAVDLAEGLLVENRGDTAVLHRLLAEARLEEGLALGAQGQTERRRSALEATLAPLADRAATTAALPDGRLRPSTSRSMEYGCEAQTTFDAMLIPEGREIGPPVGTTRPKE